MGGPKVGGHLALLLHSSREPGELSQCSKHYDSTINIVVVIIIIIIIIIIIKNLLTHSISPIIIAGGLILIYEFLALKTERGVQ